VTFSSLHEWLARDTGKPRIAGASSHWMDDQAPARFAPHAVKARGPDYVFAFHDDEELGPRMLARIAKLTGLRSEDL
jgi:hypothetical protein